MSKVGVVVAAVLAFAVVFNLPTFFEFDLKEPVKEDEHTAGKTNISFVNIKVLPCTVSVPDCQHSCTVFAKYIHTIYTT
jgi:hypothetical protein